jgi:NADPH-dependent 2,4-dienoyl-CoA reductase/sulfur reductase-like enzyme
MLDKLGRRFFSTVDAGIATQLTTDVCVIGGGVIGLAIAEALARRGREVVVLEKNR